MQEIFHARKDHKRNRRILYVQTEDKLYECKGKGNLPKQEDETVSGDNVEIDI